MTARVIVLDAKPLSAVEVAEIARRNARLVLGKEFYQMFRWFNEAGFKADIPDLRRRYPQIQLHSLEEWLRQGGWDKRARRVTPPGP